jgi:putative transposase
VRSLLGKLEDEMKKRRFKEEQIIGILKEAEVGMKVSELLRKHGISQGTYYRWKSKYGGMEVSDAKKLRGLPRMPGIGSTGIDARSSATDCDGQWAGVYWQDVGSVGL